MTLRERYLEQISRLYGQRCADASLCEPDGDGFLVNVAVEGPTGRFERRGNASSYTREQVEKMIENLSTRSPSIRGRAYRKGASYD